MRSRYNDYTSHMPWDYYIDLSKYEDSTTIRSSYKTRYRAYKNQLIATVSPTNPVAEEKVIEK